jgi:HD-GYP domain-containing protein (c-di-GMP phosphodiesterase class II)
MRFATRTFLLSFIPFAILLQGSFWVIQRMVVTTVRSGLRSSLRDSQESMARVHRKSELQNSRFLRVVGESAALKAGVQLLLSNQNSAEARLTVEDQLREICENLGFDFLLVSHVDGIPLAGVMRDGAQLTAMDLRRNRPPRRGFFNARGQTFQVTSVPIDQGDESLAVLAVGEHFDFAEFTTPAVLARKGRILRSSIPNVRPGEIAAALAQCGERQECEVELAGDTYLSLPMETVLFGDGYLLRTFQSVDRASAPVQGILRQVFLLAGLGALSAALLLSMLSSRSIVEPLRGVIANLRQGEATGVLPELQTRLASIIEIRELAESFNRAAASIAEGKRRLHQAYVEFVGSLASALDARDRYTAGHSRRVSDYSCAIAAAMGFPANQLDQLRIGSLLHDIGKIGIPDAVLQKPGRLSDEEMALIREHPTIGRHILEGVGGFQPYLPVVELHHENWDGSGYPHGLKAEATPLDARIVHVADAYDAMTSDRPYRDGMSHQDAISLIQRNAGTQFDPAIVAVFVGLPDIAPRAQKTAPTASSDSIASLARAVATDHYIRRPSPQEKDTG